MQAPNAADPSQTLRPQDALFLSLARDARFDHRVIDKPGRIRASDIKKHLPNWNTTALLDSIHVYAIHNLV